MTSSAPETAGTEAPATTMDTEEVDRCYQRIASLTAEVLDLEEQLLAARQTIEEERKANRQ